VRTLLSALLVAAFFCTFQLGTLAQTKGAKGTAYKPTEQEMAQIQAKIKALTAALDELKAAKVDDDLIVDAEVALHAAQIPLKYPEELIDQSKFRKALSVLDQGLQRARMIQEGRATWTSATGNVGRAYRSRVDGSAQPYKLTIPASYDKSKPTPLLIYLHGRGDTDFDTNWVGGNGGSGGGGKGSQIKMLAFGRFNCSYRWAGEADVLEALASVQKRYNIDPNRIALTGFSMGGAGSWYHGLHYPDLWAGLEVDAGVIGKRVNMEGLTPVQKAINTPYGIMIGHAVNLFNLPIVAYAGENDAQLAASTSIREQLVREGFPVEKTGKYEWKAKDLKALFLVNPGVGHAHASGETATKVNAFVADMLKKGRSVPDHIKFVTFTTRYNKSDWITVEGMLRHFDRAEVDALHDPAKHSIAIKTTNVSRLVVRSPRAAKTLAIDGQKFAILGKEGDADLYLSRQGDKWDLADKNWPDDGALRKKHGLQGPIDDAFMDSFLCVLPKGAAWNAVADEQGQRELARFTKEFGKTYRGDVRTKSDADINDDDIKNHNLVLFGDPSSNRLIARIAAKLPIQWTKESVTVAGKTYSAADHVPALIYPNPLNPKRYVVLNTGMSMEGQSGTPRYGDFAVLRVQGGTAQIVDNGVFDESWRFVK
jgi:pimeloyl-ACP methyl ester carboxylesterase